MGADAPRKDKLMIFTALRWWRKEGKHQQIKLSGRHHDQRRDYGGGQEAKPLCEQMRFQALPVRERRSWRGSLKWSTEVQVEATFPLSGTKPW